MLILLAIDCSQYAEDDIPIVLIHGLTKSRTDMYKLRNLLRDDYPERKIFCPNILLGALSSIFETQTRYARALASEINEFLIKEAPSAQCIDIIAHSQGGFFTRVFVQLYSGINQRYSHPVKVRRVYSLAGVMGGFYCHSQCGKMTGNNPILRAFQWLTNPKIVYSRFSQFIFTPTAQWKDIDNSVFYVKSNNLLCIINSECSSQYNVQQEIAELDLMVNFWTPDDTVISPQESEIFNFYAPGNENQIQDIQNTGLFESIGLKQLKSRKRWKRVQVPGFDHRSFIDEEVDWFYNNCLKQYINNTFSYDQDFETQCTV